MPPGDTVAVTGGGGFIGSNLVSALLAQGTQVRIVDNFLSGHRVNVPIHSEAVSLREGDITTPGVLDEVCAGASAVFHLAASVGNKRSIDDPIRDSEINVLGTLRVLEAARHAGVQSVVVSSSAGIFGELKTLPIAEDHPIDPDSPYGVSKLAAEKQCLAYAKLYPLRAVALRYFNVYGPNQRFDAYGNVIPIFAFKMLRGEPITIFGDGEQTRDFVHVDDVVQANLRASTEGPSRAYNVGSGTTVTINRLVELMEEVSGIRANVTHGPPRPGDVRHSRADVSEAERHLGFAPSVRLEDGLRDYMAWARREVARP
ncbi:MAG: NAD-dependent epimerase/dehydratase family protein [Myxococcota bacterium]